MPTVAIWVQLQSILCQTELSVVTGIFRHPGTLTRIAERQSARRMSEEATMAHHNAHRRWALCNSEPISHSWNREPLCFNGIAARRRTGTVGLRTAPVGGPVIWLGGRSESKSAEL